VKRPLRGQRVALEVARLTGHHDLPIIAIRLVDDQARPDPPPLRDRALGAPAEEDGRANGRELSPGPMV
jgi:hypothetical protein